MTAYGPSVGVLRVVLYNHRTDLALSGLLMELAESLSMLALAGEVAASMDLPAEKRPKRKKV